MIENWGRIMSNLKWLIRANDNPYFDLMEFCTIKNINYNEILIFIKVGKQILNGSLNPAKDLKFLINENEKIVKQLEIMQFS